MDFAIRPLYLQIRDALAAKIASHEWTSATPIPNEVDLARSLGVSAGTMRKALKLLEREGLLTRHQGRGTFVNDPTAPENITRYSHLFDAGGQRIPCHIAVIDATAGAANDVERQRLGLDEGQHVHRIRRVCSSSSGPYQMEDVTLPKDLFPQVSSANLCSQSIVAIAHAHHVLLGSTMELISIAAASRWATQLLGLVEGAPVLIMDRLIATREGKPAEWRRAECGMRDMHYKVESCQA